MGHNMKPSKAELCQEMERLGYLPHKHIRQIKITMRSSCYFYYSCFSLHLLFLPLLYFIIFSLLDVLLHLITDYPFMDVIHILTRVGPELVLEGDWISLRIAFGLNNCLEISLSGI